MFVRRLFFMSACIALVSCSGSYGGSATPSVAGPNTLHGASVSAILDSAPQVAGGREVFRKLSMRPEVAAPPILINFLADGPNQGGVPCINCVDGASSSDNVGMTGPSSYVRSNFTWQYALSFTDISYKGKCKLAWAITAGKQTIDSFSASLNLTSSGGFVLYAVARPRPKYSGAATLTGKVTCGKTAQSLQAPLQFE
jgi:hypothetical protein